MLCDKTEKAIKKEINTLTEAGSTRQQAAKQVDTQKVCGSTAIEAADFEGKDTVIIRVPISHNAELTGLVCDAYSWHESDVESEIIWIEKQ